MCVCIVGAVRDYLGCMHHLESFRAKIAQKYGFECDGHRAGLTKKLDFCPGRFQSCFEILLRTVPLHLFFRLLDSHVTKGTHTHTAASTQLVVFCLVWAQHLTEFPGGSGKTALKRIASNEAYLLLEKATQFTHRASNFPLWDKVWCALCS